jgi:hypothetical protein
MPTLTMNSVTALMTSHNHKHQGDAHPDPASAIYGQDPNYGQGDAPPHGADLGDVEFPEPAGTAGYKPVLGEENGDDASELGLGPGLVLQERSGSEGSASSNYGQPVSASMVGHTSVMARRSSSDRLSIRRSSTEEVWCSVFLLLCVCWCLQCCSAFTRSRRLTLHGCSRSQPLVVYLTEGGV